MYQTPVKKKNVGNGQQGSRDHFFHFYEMMNYPIPRLRIFFAYKWFLLDKNNLKTEIWSEFSRNSKSALFSEFLTFIQKWNWIYSQFPFIKQIFLANSITFNALKSSSDIDLFVVTQKGRIWTARFFMSIMMLFFQIKRNSKNEFKRFCLSFFVDEEHIDLEPLLLSEKDVYLPYWIAHLVPLYQEQRSEIVFQKNVWISHFLPYFPKRQAIFLWNSVILGKWLFKKLVERSFRGMVWEILERWIKKIWLTRMKRLQKDKPELHQGVIISDWILKFHYDQRKKYSDLFFS